MIKIDLKNEVLEEPILELETEKGIIDLHNDYVCKNVSLESQSLQLDFETAKSTKDYKVRATVNKIQLLFKNCNILNINNFIRNIGLSLDNLSKSNLKNGGYFYILSFTDGDEFELECDDCFLNLLD